MICVTPYKSWSIWVSISCRSNRPRDIMSFSPIPIWIRSAPFQVKSQLNFTSFNLVINKCYSLQASLGWHCLISAASSLHARWTWSAYVVRRPRAAIQMQQSSCSNSRSTQLPQQRNGRQRMRRHGCRIICKHWSQSKLPNTMEAMRPSSRYAYPLPCPLSTVLHPSSSCIPPSICMPCIYLAAILLQISFWLCHNLGPPFVELFHSALSQANPVRANNP